MYPIQGLKSAVSKTAKLIFQNEHGGVSLHMMKSRSAKKDTIYQNSPYINYQINLVINWMLLWLQCIIYVFIIIEIILEVPLPCALCFPKCYSVWIQFKVYSLHENLLLAGWCCAPLRLSLLAVDKWMDGWLAKEAERIYIINMLKNYIINMKKSEWCSKSRKIALTVSYLLLCLTPNTNYLTN